MRRWLQLISTETIDMCTTIEEGPSLSMRHTYVYILHQKQEHAFCDSFGTDSDLVFITLSFRFTRYGSKIEVWYIIWNMCFKSVLVVGIVSTLSMALKVMDKVADILYYFYKLQVLIKQTWISYRHWTTMTL